MLRIDTMANSAKMIKFKAIQDGASIELVGHMVGNSHSSIYVEIAITSPTDCCCPQPAWTKVWPIDWNRTGFVYFRPKAAHG